MDGEEEEVCSANDPFRATEAKDPTLLSDKHFVAALEREQQSVRFITSFVLRLWLPCSVSTSVSYLNCCSFVFLCLFPSYCCCWWWWCWLLTLPTLPTLPPAQTSPLRCCWSDTKHGQYKLLATPLSLSLSLPSPARMLLQNSPAHRNLKLITRNAALWLSVCCTCSCRYIYLV